MKNLLYIGNKLHKHGFNKTSIETFGVSLAEEGFSITYSSDKKNQLLRLLDMVWTTFLKARKVDYILIDTYSTSSFWYAFFCSQVARIMKTKYIPILHGGALPNRLQKNPFLCKMIFKNAFINVAPSNYLVEKFKENGFENVIFIPNSIPLEDYAFKQRTQVEPKLLWVRAFAELYNPKMAVQVLKVLKEKYPNASLTMVGPDKDGSLLTTKAFAESLKLNVIFTGKRSKNEWTDEAKNHDIFINTTHFDNTPISVLEAMALGLPVVSTDVGGIPFMLSNHKNALLVHDDTPEEMVKAIEDLIANATSMQNLTLQAKVLVDSMDWHLVKLRWKALLV